jgi:hypothetical protein
MGLEALSIEGLGKVCSIRSCNGRLLFMFAKEALPFSKRRGSAWRYEPRGCEFCAREFEPVRRRQRFCSPECKQQFKNAELQAARKLYARAGRPTLEEIMRKEEAA